MFPQPRNLSTSRKVVAIIVAEVLLRVGTALFGASVEQGDRFPSLLPSVTAGASAGVDATTALALTAAFALVLHIANLVALGLIFWGWRHGWAVAAATSVISLSVAGACTGAAASLTLDLSLELSLLATAAGLLGAAIAAGLSLYPALGVRNRHRSER